MIAFTISPSLDFNAWTAFARVQKACVITNSMSLESTPVSSTTSSSALSTGYLAVESTAGAGVISGVRNCSAAAL